MGNLLDLVIEGMKSEAAFFMILGEDLRDGPDIGMAYSVYAESLGKTVESLTLEEKQQAMLNAVLEQYKDD